MAYVPPHKRRSGKAEAPTPDSMAPILRRTLNSRSHSGNNHRKWFPSRISYAPNETSKWFLVGLGSCFGYSDRDADKFMSFTKVEPFSSEPYEIKFGQKPRALVLDHDRIKKYDGEIGVVLENPWDFIAENVKQDLVLAIQRVQNQIKDDDCELNKATLVARFGRVVFKGQPPTSSEGDLIESKGSFYTNVSPSFVQHVVEKVTPKLRADVERDKESYVVQFSDSMDRDSTVSCKCTVAKDGKTLQIYKIQFNQVRHFVASISCLGESLDLRLMLYTRRTANAITEDEMKCLESVTGSAILDPEAKGGIRWPSGTSSPGNRYTVIAVWHNMYSKSLRNSSIRLKVRRAVRFDYRSSLEEVFGEVNLRMFNIMSHFKGEPMQGDLLTEMLRRSNLKLIWDNFVCFPSTT